MGVDCLLLGTLGNEDGTVDIGMHRVDHLQVVVAKITTWKDLF